MNESSHTCISKESGVRQDAAPEMPLPAPVWSVGETTSVLDAAHAMEDALPLWGSVLAETQTAGRGQMRRHWHSPPGNIYAALRLPVEPPFSGTEAAPVLGALLVKALRALGLDARLKWPNDLVLLHDREPRKVGGILLEERQGRLVAGIGINRVWAPPQEEMRLGHAMPACHLGGFTPPRLAGEDMLPPAELLWRRLVNGVFFWYTKKLRNGCPWQLLAEAHLLWKGAPVMLSDGDRKVEGVLQGFGPSGGVRLVTDGQVQEFLSGSLARAMGHTDVPEGQYYE